MIKVVLDTSVFISSFPGRRASEPGRTQKAQCVISYLEENNTFLICYSERTERELEHDSHFYKLGNYTRLNSHLLNQKIDETEETWDNIATVWNDQSEVDYGDELLEALTDKPAKTNKNDRGIYGDAMLEHCRFLIHENPRDFDRFQKQAEKDSIIMINLLKHSCTDVIQMLKQTEVGN